MRNVETPAQTSWRLGWAETKAADLMKSLSHILEVGDLTDPERDHLKAAKRAVKKAMNEIHPVRGSVQERK